MKIRLQNADNARDFTGIKNTEGKEIRTRLFIRSNNLNTLTDEDVNCLVKEYNLKKVIDLRTDVEVSQKPDRPIEGVTNMNIPVFDASVIGITHEKGTDMQAVGLADIPDMAELYVRMVTDKLCIRQLSKIMNMIVDNVEGAILWHCTEGKDRCGIVSALFLTMLGVSREDILEDYLATNISAAKRAQGFYDKILEITGNEEKAIEIKGAFMANKNYFDAAFDAILENYSSVPDYIQQELKIGSDRIERLRKRCL